MAYFIQLWNRFWSQHHGPVYSTEPDLTVSILEDFRRRICEKLSINYTPIWQVMKDTQDVFNGFGAQEACDALCAAHIHPRMPVTFICKNSVLWNRFQATVIEQHCSRVRRIQSKPILPYASKEMAFCMNTKGHNMYSQGILCYRREKVYVTQKWLDEAHAMGLLDPNAVLGEDGIAKAQMGDTLSDSHNFCAAPQKVRGKTVGLLNYVHKIPKNQSSSTSINMYSPFVCQCPEDWSYALEVYGKPVNFIKCINETTLGPYSFQIFVDTVWSKEHMDADATKLVGRPAIEHFGNGHYKRPKIANIRSGVSHKSSIRNLQKMHYGLDDTSEAEVEEPLIESKPYEGGRVLRSSKTKEKRMPY
ncbi:fatty acid synthase alpha subunit Lsd1 [Stygiomarasmius scandens]|uniref:Fatty acid synthase alpha subunit Lsd1 n=1 Tax=Marasmiellus scandens TaxID=2682957 RepID=A0ABR1IPJ4_9AGAR